MKAIIEMVLCAITKPVQSISNTCACVNYNYFIKCVSSLKDATLKPQNTYESYFDFFFIYLSYIHVHVHVQCTLCTLLASIHALIVTHMYVAFNR